MLIRRPADIASSEITPKDLYVNRRQFIETAGLIAGASLIPGRALTAQQATQSAQDQQAARFGQQALRAELTPREDVTTYNNFYEFGTGKPDPARNAQEFVPKPWTIAVGGQCLKPRVFDVDEMIAEFPAEERVYRMRCVEAWSMVIPWRGIPLADLIKSVEPTSDAKYVSFLTLYDPERMPGQKAPVLDWPYREGLRMDEAMNPLALLATGVYGEDLPNQNGAPIRLVTPWKYGFKGIKSIVSIQLTKEQPQTTWSMSNAREYGFYANVNPEVDHPRWSQARERRIGEFRMRETLPFNGYADQVASLYEGMDLRVFY